MPTISAVRSRELRKWRGEARVVAKIERHEALDNLAGILAVTDAVMVARGDLGVEMGYAELTGLQKTIIRQSLQRNRVVITATQMMESMIQNPMPTRAEVSDVANAVLDGTDAVMLSAETRGRQISGQGRAGDGRRHPRRREISARRHAHHWCAPKRSSATPRRRSRWR